MAAKKKFFYLSIDFLRDKPFTPKQELHQIQVADGYPKAKELSVHGTENPNLMPKAASRSASTPSAAGAPSRPARTWRWRCSICWAITSKPIPKYGSEKKGQPTTYYLSAAPEPIRVNCDYFYVDVVLSADPNVLRSTPIRWPD